MSSDAPQIVILEQPVFYPEIARLLEAEMIVDIKPKVVPFDFFYAAEQIKKFTNVEFRGFVCPDRAGYVRFQRK